MPRHVSLVVAVVLMAIGALFLVANLVPGLSGLERWWPLIGMAPGLWLLWQARSSFVAGQRSGDPRLLLPGLAIVTIALVFLFASLSGRSQVWSYAWPLVPAAVGLGIYLGSQIGHWGLGTRTLGRWLILSGLGAFAVLALLFEGFFYRGLGWVVVVVALLALGTWLLLRSIRSGRSGRYWP